MAAAQFSDDAYNKFLKQRQGTLIGNWAEERVLRDSSGEGRTVPQRHIPRAGLLTDWTKIPSGGARKGDDTFERIYGPKAQCHHVALSKVIGGGEADVFLDRPVAETLQAEGRIPRYGTRALLQRAARDSAAELDMQAEEAEIDRTANDRYFDTQTGSVFTKPNEAEVEKPVHTRQSFKNELLYGPRADRTSALQNCGLEVLTHSHYSNVEGVTHARMSLVDHKDPKAPGGVGLRNDMRVSASTGVSAFGKNSEFTKPVADSLLGLGKDEELAAMYAGLANTKPARSTGGPVPRAAPFQGVPSLAALKTAVFSGLQEIWGAAGYVTLRQRLFDVSDDEGFITKSDVVAVLREQVGLSDGVVPDSALAIYLNQLVTMRKGELHVGALMASLRPALVPEVKRRVLTTFSALGPQDGCIRLESWLNTINDDALKETIITAFGAGDVTQVADMPISEQVFVELLSDLAPIGDPDALLSC